MAFNVRACNWILLALSAIMEIVAFCFLIQVLISHCVRGGEYGISVWFYAYFLPGILLQTLHLAIFRIICRTVGLDPIALIFNLASGILLIIATIILLVAMSDHCQNEYADAFFATASCGLVAGIFHLLNGILCLVFIPPEDSRYLKPTRRSNG